MGQCVGLQRGGNVWVYNVGAICGSTTWGQCVGL